MNPYIINRQPQPNLVDAFMRGYGQMDDIRANKQTREMNDLRLQGERDQIEQQKQAMANNQKLTQLFGTFLQKNRGDANLAQQEAINTVPELALPLTEMFKKLKDAQGDPNRKLKEQAEAVSYQSKIDEPKIAKAKQMAFMLGLQPNEELEQQYFPRPLEQAISDLPLDGTPEQMLAYGLGPKEYMDYQEKQKTTSNKPLIKVSDTGEFVPVDPYTGKHFYTGQSVKTKEGLGQYIVVGDNVFKNTKSGLVPATSQTGEPIKKPLSSDAAKVLTIAETMQDEINELKGLYKKNSRGTLLAVKTGVGEAGRIISQIEDKIGRLRSGGAINGDEEKRFRSLLGRWSDLFEKGEGGTVAIQALDRLLNEAQSITQKMGGVNPTVEVNNEDPLGLGLFK